MTKLSLLAALGLLAVVPAAYADEPAAAPAATEAPAAEAAAPATTEAAPAAEVKEVTLKDGTKVVIEGDMVSVVAEDGTKTAAPDGEHELADGTKVKTAEGKLVKE